MLGRLVDRSSWGLEGASTWAGRIIAFAVVLLCGEEVISRYVFNQPHDWAGDFQLIGMLYAAMLGVGEAVKRDRHVAVDMLLEKIRGRLHNAMRVINTVAELVFLVILTYLGAIQVSEEARLGLMMQTTVPVPFWFVHLLIPIGAGIAALFAIEKLVKLLLGGYTRSASVELA